MSFTGMDIAGVRGLATQMTHSAGEIQQLTNQLTSQLQNTSWIGPDREHFVGDWQSTHVVQLNQVINALNDAAMRANQNAQEQENASQNS
jgi:uncharacterized protein YukE